MGYAEYWIVDTNQRVTWIHADPQVDTWRSMTKRVATEELTTPAVPGFALRLSDVR